MGSDGSTRWISSMDTATAAHATASSAHVAPFGVRMASCAAFQDLWASSTRVPKACSSARTQACASQRATRKAVATRTDVLGASRRFAALGAVPDHGAGQSTCASAPGRSQDTRRRKDRFAMHRVWIEVEARREWVLSTTG
eukprot:jgi/Pico_ML_1/53325/g3894.t2